MSPLREGDDTGSPPRAQKEDHMSRFHLTALFAAAVAAGASHAQEPALTSGSIPGARTSVGALQRPASVCWYNGDLDFRAAFTSERNTVVCV